MTWEWFHKVELEVKLVFVMYQYHLGWTQIAINHKIRNKENYFGINIFLATPGMDRNSYVHQHRLHLELLISSNFSHSFAAHLPWLRVILQHYKFVFWCEIQLDPWAILNLNIFYLKSNLSVMTRGHIPSLHDRSLHSASSLWINQTRFKFIGGK